MEHVLKVLSVAPVTHNVRRIRLEKPEGYRFSPGQATDVALNREGWRDEKRPFTFTALNSEPYLEFTIKCYTDHEGVTNEIGKLEAGDELILEDPWGAIEYKGEGYFIAGGAGITPFISILRQLNKEGRLAANRLFFSNRTTADIIYERELKDMLGRNAVFVVTEAKQGYIDETFLKDHVDDFSKHFYICGPDAMTEEITAILTRNGADPDTVVFEK